MTHCDLRPRNMSDTPVPLKALGADLARVLAEVEFGDCWPMEYRLRGQILSLETMLDG